LAASLDQPRDEKWGCKRSRLVRGLGEEIFLRFAATGAHFPNDAEQKPEGAGGETSPS